MSEPEFWLVQVNGSGNWYISWYDAPARRTRRQSTGTADKALAQIKLAEHILKHGKPVRLEKAGAQIAIFLHHYNTAKASTPSAEFNSYAIPALIEELGTATVGELTLERQESLVEAFRRRGWADSSINRHITILRAALRRAWKAELLDSVPFIAGIDEGEPEPKHIFTLDQMIEFLDRSMAVEHLFRFNLLSINTLSRPCALFDLDPVQVRFDHDHIKLNPDGRRQTKKFRPIVPITDSLRPWLRYWDAQPAPEPKGKNVEKIGRTCREANLAYVNWRGEKIGDIGKVFARIGIDMGLVENPRDPPEEHRSLISPYCIRHTMATELAKGGVLKEERDRFMGHKIPGSGENYIHFEPSYLRAAKEVIDTYMEKLPARIRRPAALKVVGG